MPVIIKFFSVLNQWGICHEKSHQAAFRQCFENQDQAVNFAISNGAIIKGVQLC